MCVDMAAAMGSLVFTLALATGQFATVTTAIGDGQTGNCEPGAESFHGLKLTALDGATEVPLSRYAGKVILIVNVASFCDFTPQYLDLNRLKETELGFEDGLEILGIPSNQFGLQEPGANEYEIRNSLKYCRPGHGFEPNFDLFEKSDVNGENELPLYTLLKNACPAVKEEIGDPAQRFWTPFRNNDITWNFNKFLIGSDGVPLKRYDSAVEPMKLVGDIREAIRDGRRAHREAEELARPRYVPRAHLYRF